MKAKFTQSANLTTHVKSVHEGKKYPCNQCEKSFTRSDKLKTHVKYSHKQCDKDLHNMVIFIHM